jgi:hypothetical protein
MCFLHPFTREPTPHTPRSQMAYACSGGEVRSSERSEHHRPRAGTYSGGRGGGLGGAATAGALAHVLLEGVARGDGALLAQGVVLGGHGGRVLGVGLGGAAPRGVVGDVAGVLGLVSGEERGQATLRNKPRPRRRNSQLMPGVGREAIARNRRS